MNNEVVELKINEHSSELKEHNKRLDRLEENNAEFRVEIKNLCDNIKNLTNIMKWFMGLLIGSFVGFFFYAIQQGLFK